MAPDVAAQAAVEGVLLARYRYNALKGKPQGTPLTEVTIVAPRRIATRPSPGGSSGAGSPPRRVNLARDLNNTPGGLLTATRFGEVAQEIGPERGLEVEVFDKDAHRGAGAAGACWASTPGASSPRG